MDSRSLLKAACVAVCAVTLASFLPCLGGQLYAQTYYVSGQSVTGDGSQGDPWGNLDEITGLASGCTVLVDLDHDVRGTMLVQNLQNLTFGAYGTGTKAIKGSHLVLQNQWTLYANETEGDIYEVELPLTAFGEIWDPFNEEYVPDIFVSHVYKAEELKTLARFPNMDDPLYPGGWLRNDDGSTTTITDADLVQPTGYWVGASAVIRSHNFSYRRSMVTAHSGSEITFAPAVYDMEDEEWGYFFINKFEELDQPEEWYFDDVSRTLYYMVPTGDGAPVQVEATTRKRGFRLFQCENVTVTGLNFMHYAEAGLRPESSDNVDVENCNFDHLVMGFHNSSLSYSDGSDVKHSHFTNCYRYGMSIESDNGAVEDNEFVDIGLIPGFGGMLPDINGQVQGNEYGSYSALVFLGSNSAIKHNRIERAGNNGIAAKGNDVTIESNYVRQAQYTLNDGGAITFDDCDHMVVQSNIVLESQGNLESCAPDDRNYQKKGVGIYLGDRPITNLLVQANTVSGCVAGMHADHRMTNLGNRFIRNTLFGNEVQLSITDFSNYKDGDELEGSAQGVGGPNYQGSFDDVYKGNIMYSTREDQRCMEQSPVWAASYRGTDPITDFGSFSGNYYFNPFSDVPIWLVVKYIDDHGYFLHIPHTLQQWKERWPGEEVGSFVSPLHKARHLLGTLSGSLLNGSAEFTNGPDGWLENSCMEDVGGNELGFGNSLAVYADNTGTDCQWTFPTNATNTLEQDKFRLSFYARADVPTTITGHLLDNGTNHPFGKGILLGSEPKFYELFFDLNPTPFDVNMYPFFRNAALVGQVHGDPPNPEPAYWIDEVELQKCTFDATHETLMADEHLLYYYSDIDGTQSDPWNTASTAGVIEVPGGFSDCWSDVYGNIYRGNDEIELLEWESMVLFKVSNTFDYSNGYTVSATVETWTEDKNIKGTLYIPSGKTLIVDGATIGFAHHGTTPTTCVYVHPGGNLRLINGAKFTSVPGSLCEPGMWDGVMVLGNGTSTGGGVIEMTTGAGISNALVGIKNWHSSPSSAGGNMVLDGSVFDNNQRDILRTPYGSAANPPFDVVVNNCAFITTRPLLDPLLSPTIHVSLISGGRTFFHGCTFANLQSELPEPEERGTGLSSVIADVIIEPLDEDAPRTRFENLFEGLKHEWGAFTHTFFIDRTDFLGCSRSAHGVADMHSTFVRNLVEVRGTESSWPPNRGTYMHGCNLFEYEDNTFIGMDDGAPKAGSVFSNCSASAESVYHNQYDGFDGDDGTNFSAGLVISGTNSNTDGSAGLKWKCNAFSSLTANDHDVAFTGEEVLVAVQQGSAMSHKTLAGNTFLELDDDCTSGNESRHFYVKQDYDVNEFHYWYHLPETARELAPLCASPQIVQATQYHQTIISYEDDPVLGSCPSELGFLMDDGDLEDEIIYAEEQKETLSDVYDDWRDGGSTEGLIQFIQDTDNDSYDVRNELMLVAPSVSIAAWEEVFERTPAMNPWHIAQALIANSPLQSEVLRMLPEYDFHPYYEALVWDAQNGGTSMHNFYLSEISDFNAQQSRALDDLTRKALRSADTTDLINARTWHNDHPVSTSSESMVSLCYVLNDLQRARQIVDAELNASPYRDYWEVHDLYLSLLENDEGPLDLDYSGQMSLLPLALSDDRGSGEAQAWLTLLGGSFEDNVILPTHDEQRLQSVRQERVVAAPPVFINVHPNPSNGPVVVVMNLPEGSDGGEVRITDPQGRLIHQQRFQGEVQLLELDTRNLTTGAYAAELVADDIRIGVAKFHLIR